MALTTSLPPPVFSRWPALLGNLAIILGLAGLAVLIACQSRLHHQRQAEISADNLSQLLGKHIGGFTEKMDLTLRIGALEILQRQANGNVDPKALEDFLARQQSLLADLDYLRVTDADGIIAYGPGVRPGSDISVADREYFVTLKADAKAGLVISGPHRGRISDEWVMVFARRLEKPDGSFAGIVFGAVGASRLGAMISSLDLGPNGFVALRTGKLDLIARHPGLEDREIVGTRDLPDAFEASLKRNPGHGVYTAVSALDGVERTAAYRRLPQSSLYVVVGLATQDYLAAWWKEAVGQAAIFAIFGGLILWLLHRAQAAARRQQEANRLLREAVDNIAIGFSIFDPDDRLVVCNEAGRDFFAVNRDVLVPGAKFEDIVRRGFDRQLYLPSPEGDEYMIRDRIQRHRAADGKPFQQDLGNGRQLLIIEHRTPSGHVVCNRIEITELAQHRERLEQLVESRTAELRATAARFRIFVEQAPISIAMFDEAMHYLACSRHWCRDLGLAGSGHIGRSHYEVDPEIPERLRAIHRAALAGTPQKVDEDLWERSDGSRQWKRWAVYPWTDERDAIGGIIVVGEDITARKAAEQAYRSNEERLRMALEAAHMNVFEYDPATDRVHREGALVMDLGIPADSTGSAYYHQLHADDRPRFADVLARLSPEMPAYTFEYRFHLDDGSYRWLADHARGYFDPQGRLVRLLGVCADISVRKEAEMEIQRLNADLERRVAERTAQLQASNQELQGFTYAASHDMKGPLGRISSFSTLLERKYRDRLEGEGLLFLDFIRSNAQRLTDLIEDLLRHAQIELHSLELEPVDLPGAIQAILLEKNDDIREADARLELHLPAAGLLVSANFQGLAQILRNLVENALKYSAGANPPTLEIGCRQEGDRCRLWVRDNGIGFDMAYHDRIFEIFRRLHTYEEFPGSGVGLALVKKAVDRMGGKVWAESAPGQGAAFFLDLPLWPSAAAAPGALAATAERGA